jgi:glycosyltransferase involved in cell wall biosynthesis
MGTRIKIDVCIITKDKKELDTEKMNLSILPINNILISDLPGRARARTDLIKKVKTPYFIFLDDDVRINEDWWNKIRQYIDGDPEMAKLGCEARRIGAVQGFGFPKSKIMKYMRLFLLKIRGKKYQRGFTSNTLIRTEAVKGVKLNDENRFEDIQLQEHILSKGYEWIFINAYCMHMKPSIVVLKEAWHDFNRLRKEKGSWKAVMRI